MTERPRLNKLAIAAGVAVDMVGSIVFGLGVLMAAVVLVSVKGQQPIDNIIDIWLREIEVLVTLLVIGLAWQVIGGFTAAKIAARLHVRHAAWTGAIVLVLSGLFELLPEEGPGSPLWFDVVGYPLTIPASLAGGALARPRTVRPLPDVPAT